MTNGITTTPVEGGFRWPWQTPPGEGFMAPWTPQESYMDPTGQMMYQPAPPAPTAPMQPMGPDYGPYSDPGQIPPELLELYDWEPFEEQYINEEGKTARITMYRLIPKAGMSEAERRRIELAEAEFIAKYGEGAAGAEPERFPLPSGQAQTTWDDSGMEWFWNEYSGRYEETGRYNQAYDMRLQQAEAAVSTPEGMSAYEEDYLRYLREKLASEQGLAQQGFGLEQQQYAAQLAAQPKSWLEYAAYTGQPPVVQPWMKPLMPQQYPELAGLRAGQPIPGWPEQFTGTNAATYGGAYQPWMAQPGGIGAQPTAGYGGYETGMGGGGVTPTGYETSIPASRFSALGTSAQGQVSGNLSALSNYVAQGMSPYDAALRTLQDAIAKGADPELAEYATGDALRLYWEQTGTKPTTSGLAGLQMSSLGTRPETFSRYGEAIANVESGQPLMGGLSSREKMSLVGQMVNEGWDRTLAERYVFGGAERFRPYKTIPETTTPTYTPLPTREPTPTTQYVPGEEYRLPAPTPTRERTTTQYELPKTSTQKYLEERERQRESGETLAYIPGRSWHDVENTSTNTLGDATWLARMEKLPTTEGTQTTTQTPNWMGDSTSQTYNPAAYAAGNWAGYNPNLPLGQMPALVRPSRQYQARMGPTALDQYYAYAQGRTGITPEEMQFRLWSTAPPGGGYSGLRWMR